MQLNKDMISIKKDYEINLIKKSSSIIKKIFEEIKEFCVPNISTLEISKKIGKIIEKFDAKPAFLNYNGFPEVACISINDTVIHGIPKDNIYLKNGDIVSIDVGVNFNNYFSDACRTYLIGDVKDNAKKIVKVSEECFFKAVSLIKPGIHLGDISFAIEEHAKKNGFSVPREFAGHGIGSHLHEDPFVFNYGLKNTGPVLLEGMCLAIEPIILEGDKDIKTLEDGWTVKTKDGKLSSHYENTVLVTKNGCEVLTL